MEASLKDVLNAVRFGTYLVALLLTIHIFKYSSGLSLTQWGVFPREVNGMIGVITSPLVHGSWGHLVSNCVPLLVTTSIIHFFYKRVAVSSFFLIYFLTGAAVWMFGRSVYHIGASGVVYGLIAFIFWTGVFRRNVKSIVLSLVVIILYAGYLEGIVPFQEGISWESHLLGAVVGLIIAFFLKGLIEKDEVPHDPWADEALIDSEYFFKRDIFERTITQRLTLEDEEE